MTFPKNCTLCKWHGRCDKEPRARVRWVDPNFNCPGYVYSKSHPTFTVTKAGER